jgi:hypothetical protein
MHGTWLKVPEERRTVEQHARGRGERVMHCDTHDDLCECTSNTMVRTVVTDLDAWPPGGAYEVARRLAVRTDPIVLHALHRLTPRAIDELRVLARTKRTFQNLLDRRLMRHEASRDRRTLDADRAAVAAGA